MLRPRPVLGSHTLPSHTVRRSCAGAKNSRPVSTSTQLARQRTSTSELANAAFPSIRSVLLRRPLARGCRFSARRFDTTQLAHLLRLHHHISYIVSYHIDRLIQQPEIPHLALPPLIPCVSNAQRPLGVENWKPRPAAGVTSGRSRLYRMDGKISQSDVAIDDVTTPSGSDTTVTDPTDPTIATRVRGGLFLSVTGASCYRPRAAHGWSRGGVRVSATTTTTSQGARALLGRAQDGAAGEG
jgi:hypothetical protein